MSLRCFIFSRLKPKNLLIFLCFFVVRFEIEQAANGSLLLRPLDGNSCDPVAIFGAANLKRPAPQDDAATSPAKRAKTTTTWGDYFNTRQLNWIACLFFRC